jgi:hypothetical protein
MATDAEYWKSRYDRKCDEFTKLKANCDRMMFLIAKGELYFGTLWRQASTADIDHVMAAIERGELPTGVKP